MRSDVVIVACVRLQNLAQMHLAQDNDVVHTLAPDRSDQKFDNAILSGRGWCGRLVPDTHGAQSARDNAAIDPIPIADEVVRSLVPRKCLRYLTRNPFGRRICCDVGPDEVSAAEPDDDEGIEQVARLRDFKPELEQFAVDARRAPKRIFDAHPPDQRAQLRFDLRSPSQWARLPTPVAAKTGPMPTHERLRPDDCENLHD